MIDECERYDELKHLALCVEEFKNDVSEFVTWDKDGMGAGDDLVVDLDGLTEAVRTHEWDVVPIVTVHDGMAESVIEMEAEE